MSSHVEFAKLKRIVSYNADYGGCYHWRLGWAHNLITNQKKGIITDSTVMILDKKFYQNVYAVSLQRQAAPIQVQFAQSLKTTFPDLKLFYNVDDIVIAKDIPMYNKNRKIFADPTIQQGIQQIMGICDEVVVTNQYMADYYLAETKVPHATIIPNYLPKYLFGHFYDRTKINKKFEDNKKFRVGYFGSGTHIDLNMNTGYDDFTHVTDSIIKNINEFQWVFVGCFPLKLKPFVDSKKIEFIPWVDLFSYPALIDSLNIQATIAPLMDNVFNRAKSDIKFLEAGAYGIPCVVQDLCTYKDAFLKFNTGDEMIDHLKKLRDDRQYYTKQSKACRNHAEKMWLEDNLDKYLELYNFT